MENSLASARAAAAASRRSAPKRFGCETPRIFTPPMVELTPETSLGFECIDFAENVLEITLLPWQKWLLIHALELTADGEFRFRTVVLLVARQSGKSTLMLVLTLWRMYLDRAQLVIGTAQNLDLSEELWDSAVELAESIPELASEIPRNGVVRNNGKKALKLRTGERYKVAAASRKGGRGFSGDLILMDELREHHSFDSWSAVTKTTMARSRAQIWAASNAGDAMSIVLRRLRALAHQALGWPDGNEDEASLGSFDEGDDLEDDADSLGIFEWSAPPKCLRSDRDAWAQANPSMGYTITERAIAAAMRTDPDSVFRTEVLCQWITTAAGGPYPDESWNDCLDNDSKIADGSKVGACVDVSTDRSWSHIVFAGYRDDGLVHVEVVATRAGTDWVLPWLVERKASLAAVTLQANGAPVSSLWDDLAAKNDDDEPLLPMVKWEGSELAKACGSFYDAVTHRSEDNKPAPLIRHLAQPALDVAASTASINVGPGGAWLIDRKRSPTDASPLVAANGAVWVLDQIPSDPVVSAYAADDWDLVVL